MATKITYLVRRLVTGHQFSVVATSLKGAMRTFLMTYHGFDQGEEFIVKERLGTDQCAFRLGKNQSFRTIKA